MKEEKPAWWRDVEAWKTLLVTAGIAVCGVVLVVRGRVRACRPVAARQRGRSVHAVDGETMKARITKPDGTIVELEGTPSEIAEACGWRAAPTYIPTPFPYYPIPWWQSWPVYTTTTLTLDAPPASTTIDVNVNGANPWGPTS